MTVTTSETLAVSTPEGRSYSLVEQDGDGPCILIKFRDDDGPVRRFWPLLGVGNDFVALLRRAAVLQETLAALVSAAEAAEPSQLRAQAEAAREVLALKAAPLPVVEAPSASPSIVEAPSVPKMIDLHLTTDSEMPKLFGARVRALGGRYSECRGHSFRRYVKIPFSTEGVALGKELLARYGGVDRRKGGKVYAVIIFNYANKDDSSHEILLRREDKLCEGGNVEVLDADPLATALQRAGLAPPQGAAPPPGETCAACGKNVPDEVVVWVWPSSSPDATPAPYHPACKPMNKKAREDDARRALQAAGAVLEQCEDRLGDTKRGYLAPSSDPCAALRAINGN